jgi:hypothetical protein
MINKEAVMKDQIASPTPGVCPLPSGTEQRLPYVEPQLTEFGDLGALTHNVGPNGNSDGGVTFGFMSSGV